MRQILLFTYCVCDRLSCLPLDHGQALEIMNIFRSDNTQLYFPMMKSMKWQSCDDQQTAWRRHFIVLAF